MRAPLEHYHTQPRTMAEPPPYRPDERYQGGRSDGASLSYYERERVGPRPRHESGHRDRYRTEQQDRNVAPPSQGTEARKPPHFVQAEPPSSRAHEYDRDREYYGRKREEKALASESHSKHRGHRSRGYSRSPARGGDAHSSGSEDKDHSGRSSRSSRHRHHHRSSRRDSDEEEEEEEDEDDLIPLDQWPKKLKNWDVLPKGFEGMAADQVKATGLFIPPSCQPKVTNLTPFVDPNRAALMLQSAGDPASMSAITSNLNPILAKQTRRAYVSGLPADISQQDIAAFFNNLMESYKFASAPGPSVVDVVPNLDKNYAFVDLRTPEEATNAMSFDGIQYRGHVLKVRRPKDYNPLMAVEQGGMLPLSTISPLVGDTPHKLFIGCIPCSLTEEQIIELLKPFGDLRSFHLVKEGPSGMSKGYAFCEYVNPEVTDIACAGLNGLELGDKKLVVQRASVGSNKPAGYSMQGLAGMGASALLPSIISKAQGAPTCVVQLLNMIQPRELEDESEYNDIVEDVRSEVGKFGKVIDMVIPRPEPGKYVAAVGKIFIQFETVQQATSALNALAGRKFADNTVITAYYPLEQFRQREF